MKENNTYEVRCTYCGNVLDLDQEVCECGKGVGYARDWNGGYSWSELNCIDNILIDKYRKR